MKVRIKTDGGFNGGEKLIGRVFTARQYEDSLGMVTIKERDIKLATKEEKEEGIDDDYDWLFNEQDYEIVSSFSNSNILERLEKIRRDIEKLREDIEEIDR